MNIKLKELITELNLSIEEEELLCFLDGNLSNDKSSRIKKIVDNNLVLKNYINNFLKLTEKSSISNPPKKVHQNLLSRLDLEENIFDICLKYFDNNLDIITGNHFFNNNRLSPAFRNKSGNQYQFQKEFNKYTLKGFVLKSSKTMLKFYFKIDSKQKNPIKNIRIEIKKNQELIKQLITDDFGSTNSINLTYGDYNFSIFDLNQIGNLSLSIK
ncbi:MAG: hypothetical protein CMF96_11085 [Candidatus Marinimicrobia bacterium]|nr:hypothetical protein [Candidatus Neomarinimicrobiota bacterium]|tara:strand:- start:6733 stop:7371 length:639 start_codon:yes stop_codon:yes gene_type:complete